MMNYVGTMITTLPDLALSNVGVFYEAHHHPPTSLSSSSSSSSSSLASWLSLPFWTRDDGISVAILILFTLYTWRLVSFIQNQQHQEGSDVDMTTTTTTTTFEDYYLHNEHEPNNAILLTTPHHHHHHHQNTIPSRRKRKTHMAHLLLTRIEWKEDDSKRCRCDDACPICLFEYHAPTTTNPPHTSEKNRSNDDDGDDGDGDDMVVETTCRHVFHENCLRQWVQQSPVCPCCRSSLVVDAPASTCTMGTHYHHVVAVVDDDDMMDDEEQQQQHQLETYEEILQRASLHICMTTLFLCCSDNPLLRFAMGVMACTVSGHVMITTYDL